MPSALLSPILRRPLFCLMLLWASGILLARHTAVPWPYWAGIGALLLFCGLATARVERVARVALYLAVLALGAGLAAWQSTAPGVDNLRYLPHGGIAIAGYPAAEPAIAPQGWTTVFHVTARRTGTRWQRAEGDIALAGRCDAPSTDRLSIILGRVLPPRRAGNPYGYSDQAYLAAHGLTYRVRAYAVRTLDAPVPESALARLRASASRVLAQRTAGPYGAIRGQLLYAILFGVHGTPLPEQLVEQFRRAGTIHLMVVSGSQIALLAGMLLFPLWLVDRGRSRISYPRLRVALMLAALPLLGWYVAVADRGPSVDRAVLMVLLGSLSVFLAVSPLARQRSFRPDGLTLLAAAALIILALRPAMLFNPGMQLSFAAVFGLFTITPVLARLLRRPLGTVALLPAATLGAQVMTFPVLAWHFGSVPVFGLLTNLVAIPLVALLLPLGMLTLLAGALSPAWATLPGTLATTLLQWLVNISSVAAGLPGAQAYWFVRSPWVVLLYLLATAAVTLALSRWADRCAEDWRVPAGREPRVW